MHRGSRTKLRVQMSGFKYLHGRKAVAGATALHQGGRRPHRVIPMVVKNASYGPLYVGLESRSASLRQTAGNTSSEAVKGLPYPPCPADESTRRLTSNL